jgi:hypothetical protein
LKIRFQIIAIYWPKWTPKGEPNLEEFDKDRSEITKKNRFGTHVHEHATNDGNISPLRLDFDVPSCTESLFSLF